jgi:ferrochelatase
MSNQAVLLVNLGSPDSTAVGDVRRYLREFLMDERVLDVPFWKRFLVVNCFILPFRPRKTAEAYRKVWLPDGSPLIVLSRQVQAALQKRLDLPVELAMRYQNPTIESIVQKLAAQGVEHLLLIPLYPHYAMSSYETVVVRVQEVLARRAPKMRLATVPPFYNDSDYLQALVASAADYLKADFDHLLFSFHGLPERHMRKADPSGAHCLNRPDCCEQPHEAHRTCYRAQAFQTVAAFVNKTGLPASKFSVSFQSRLGREPWLKPYTDFELAKFPARGIRKLLVICPSFVSDCLETLEEIGLRGRDTFREAGGDQLTLIPCLNAHPRWIEALLTMVNRFRNGTHHG